MKVDVGLSYFNVSWLNNGRREYQILTAPNKTQAKAVIQAALPWAYAIKVAEVKI